MNRVGLITSLEFALTIEDLLKMASSRSCGAYLGLVPRRKQSGKTDPELRITKAGDMQLRRLLVQCAQYIQGLFGGDSDPRTLGLSLPERGKKSAKRRGTQNQLSLGTRHFSAACNGRGPWWNVGASHMNLVIPSGMLRQLGLIGFFDERERSVNLA